MHFVRAGAGVGTDLTNGCTATATNLKCYCRTHHLVKTFWGWRDKQLPDGTVILVRYTPRARLDARPGR